MVVSCADTFFTVITLLRVCLFCSDPRWLGTSHIGGPKAIFSTAERREKTHFQVNFNGFASVF